MTNVISAKDLKFTNDIKQAIDSENDSLREISIQIHSNPEIGYEEVFPRKILTDSIKKHGFTVERHACGLGTAFITEFISLVAKDILADGGKVKTVGYILRHHTIDWSCISSSGSTDMGNVTHVVPSTHPIFNIIGLIGEVGHSISNHSVNFVDQAKTEIVHLTILRSTKGFALTSMDVLIEEGLSEAIRESFEKKVPKGLNLPSFRQNADMKTNVNAKCNY
ncbi:hypothetical protein FBU30_010760 [Linnemannia zychae]|nr:hypothetical protein FBU30_010760 [Linnemannia zychae]